MGKLYTIPSAGALERFAQVTPEYMRPNQQPYVVVTEGALDVNLCRMIMATFRCLEPYEFMHCNAVTRELDRPLAPVLDYVVEFVQETNERYWNYFLDDGPVAWLQAYEKGHNYQLHMDETPGTTRKLTAIVLLSDPLHYNGGDLMMHIGRKDHAIPRTQGTIVVFPHWLMHEVLTVTGGLRQTINMGFYGPPFR